MKTKYKFIHFVDTGEKFNEKTVWDCRNNKSDDILSRIFYYKPWKQYCFTQYAQDAIFNSSCLQDTINFMEQLK